MGPTSSPVELQLSQYIFTRPFLAYVCAKDVALRLTSPHPLSMVLGRLALRLLISECSLYSSLLPPVHVKCVQGFAESLQHCIRPQYHPGMEGSELWTFHTRRHSALRFNMNLKNPVASRLGTGVFVCVYVIARVHNSKIVQPQTMRLVRLHLLYAGSYIPEVWIHNNKRDRWWAESWSKVTCSCSSTLCTPHSKKDDQ